MTNLEAFKNKINDDISVCEAAYICSYGCRCFGKSCQGCEFFGDTAECIEAMLAESKGQSKIKLKRWEFELIGYVYRTSSVKKMFFVHYSELNYLRGVGYFKGITNEYMTLKEILDNCEVIEDE